MAENKTRGKRFYSLHEAIDIVEQDNSVTGGVIYMQPPGDGAVSDEDSGDEEDLTSFNINNLPKRQLLAEADAVLQTTSGRNMVISSTNDCEDEGVQVSSNTNTDHSDTGPSTSSNKSSRFAPYRVQKRRPSTPAEWRKKDIDQGLSTQKEWDIPPPDFLKSDYSPTSIFNWFFDEEVVGWIVTQTNKYAREEKGKHAFTLGADECQLMVAILIISGYVPLPRRRLYWEVKSDVHNEAVSEAMSRNRFSEILQCLHLADNNNLHANDRFSKVRPLLNMINERCTKYYPNDPNLSIDESMVPYFGRHGTKQCIRSKPIRFGFKNWALCTSNGYAIQVDPYQGASAGYDKVKGLGYGVVTKLLEVMEPKNVPYNVTFDNFFTSLDLIADLAEEGIAATGTIRVNRLQNCQIKGPNDLKKEDRGAFDYRWNRGSGVIVVGWNDNNAVMLASNSTGVFPLSTAKRWSAKETSFVEIPQPKIVKTYNANMGGVDRMDQNIGVYRINIRTKKWWWPIFAYLLDLCLQNAWLLHRKCPSGGMDQLSFRREIVDVYLRQYKTNRILGRPPSSHAVRYDKKVPAEVRRDGKDHYILSEKTQRRCAECGKKTVKRCLKCSVPLHLECSPLFHV